MRALSELELIEIWERGHGQHPVDQALAILVSAIPERTLADLARLSIGERDRALLDTYHRTFGARFDAVAACVRCAERLEFSFQVDDVRAAPIEPSGDRYRFNTHGYEVEYRLPNSLDLAEVVAPRDGLQDPASARALLVERCVLTAANADGLLRTADLPEAIVARLAAAMEAADPQADVALSATCPACGHAWPMCFDIVSFLWTKIAFRARQLLREVHLLARAYGWREPDVLGLSAVRRRFYLELAT